MAIQLYQLLYDYNGGDDVICCYARDLCGIDQYDVMRGDKIDDWGNRIVFDCDLSSGGRLTDYLCNDLAWFVVSPKFRRALEENGITGLQYLPINVVDATDGRTLTGYAVANVVDVVDALDLQHSKYVDEFDEDGTLYRFIHVYAIRSEQLHGRDVFRLKGELPCIFVSDKFRRVVKKNGITGCDFGVVRLT